MGMHIQRVFMSCCIRATVDVHSLHPVRTPHLGAHLNLSKESRSTSRPTTASAIAYTRISAGSRCCCAAPVPADAQ
jgi:hypothetical protein